MKNNLIILALFLFSCGESGPTACDCAERSTERREGRLETLTKSAEEQKEINAIWEEKLAPCTKKIDEDEEFKKEMEACALEILKTEFDENSENKKE